MPTYPMINIETNEVEEHNFSVKEYDQFLLDNPHLKRYHSPENLHVMSDGIRMNVPGAGTPDAAFEKYVIGRMAESIPGNTIKKNHKTRCPKEI